MKCYRVLWRINAPEKCHIYRRYLWSYDLCLGAFNDGIMRGKLLVFALALGPIQYRFTVQISDGPPIHTMNNGYSQVLGIQRNIIICAQPCFPQRSSQMKISLRRILVSKHVFFEGISSGGNPSVDLSFHIIFMHSCDQQANHKRGYA